MPRSVLYKTMNWAQIKQRTKVCDIAILPLGAMEQHGYHLPVGTDNYQIEALCLRAAEQVSDTVGAVVLPCLRYGSTTSTRFFPGTVNVSPSILIRYVLATLSALYRQGFRRFILANGHGGNSYPRQVGSEMVRLYPESEVFYTGTFGLGMWDTINADPENIMVGHAGEIETSLMLELAPQHVEMNKVTDGEMFGEFLSKYFFVLDPAYGVGTLQDRWQTMQIGARGRPFRGTQAYGKQLADQWVGRFAEVLEAMQTQSNDEDTSA